MWQEATVVKRIQLAIYIHTPNGCRLTALLEKSCRCRCSIDGRVEFDGVTLPVGTEQEILDWFNARQEVVGELFVFNREHCCSPSFVNLHISHPLDGFVRYPSHETKRYLIKVGDAERVLVLHPFPDGFLEWDVKGVLGMAGR